MTAVDPGPDWLRAAVLEQLGPRAVRLPHWLDEQRLPPVRVADQSLDSHQAHALVSALKSSTFLKPAPLVSLLKEHADPHSLDAFAWVLCQQWFDAGAPSADRWALDAVGLLGGDASAARLGPLVRAWPAQRQHRRALQGLDVLRAIGTDAALVELATIAATPRLRKVQRTAAGMLLTIAAERRLSPGQLEDRIVPTLGLDAPGGRVIEAAGKRFQVVIARDLKPVLRDDAGKPRADLPRNDEWKSLKKQLRDVLKAQSARLEAALVAERAWGAGEFQAYLVRHPIVGLLAQRLLWRAGPTTFRVTEDRTFALADESALSLPADAVVTLAHPLHLMPDERETWRQVFADHELVPPFPQLARKVHTLRPDEDSLTVLHRHDDARVEAITLLSLLERLGWERGPVSYDESDHGRLGAVGCHIKRFASAGVIAVLRHSPGVAPFGLRTTAEPQSLAGCCFVRDAARLALGQPLMVSQVDPVVVSEVLAVEETLAGKRLT